MSRKTVQQNRRERPSSDKLHRMKAEILCKNARKTVNFGILTKALVEEFFRKQDSVLTQKERSQPEKPAGPVVFRGKKREKIFQKRWEML